MRITPFELMKLEVLQRPLMACACELALDLLQHLLDVGIEARLGLCLLRGGEPCIFVQTDVAVGGVATAGRVEGDWHRRHAASSTRSLKKGEWRREREREREKVEGSGQGKRRTFACSSQCVLEWQTVYSEYDFGK